MALSIQGIVDSIGARTGASFEVVMPDGTRWRTGLGEPRFRIVLRSQAALVAAFTRGYIGLLEAWFDGKVEVEGDLGALFAAGAVGYEQLESRAVTKVENDLLEWRSSNRDPARAKTNARAH